VPLGTPPESGAEMASMSAPASISAAAVEDVAAFHLKFEPGPAGESVLQGQRQLRRGQAEPAGDRVDPRDSIRVAALSSAQQVLGLAMELAEVGPGRQVSHDVSLIARRSTSG
jgi:hypothetical protein